MKQILIILLTIVLFFGAFWISPNYISSKSASNLDYYILPDDTVKVYNYKLSNNKVSIPETLNGKIISLIADKSIGFTEKDGKKVKIPDFIINGYYGSAAHKYALKEKILFNCLHKFKTEILEDSTYSKTGTKKLICACGYSKIEKIDYKPIPDLKLNSAIADGDGIVLKWNKIDKISDYNIYRSIDGKEYKKIISVDDNNYTDYDVDSANVKYYITGSGGKNEGKKNFSPITINYLKSPAVKLVSKKDGISISWNSAKNAVKYRIYKKDNNGNYQKIYETANQNTKTYLDKNVEKHINYYYSVVSVDKSGKESAKSTHGKELTFGEQSKVVYLTFDDGPSNNTLKILKILKKYNAKATFFVTGNDKTEYMKNIVDSGHQIALHTYSHDYKKIYESVDSYFKDLNKIHDLVLKKTGVDTKIIRFPGGASNTISANYSKGIMTKLTKMVEDKGYKYFDWNISSGDADANNVPAKSLIKNIRTFSKGVNSCVVLMHDTGAKKTTVDALDKICKYYKENGYEFAPLSVNSPVCHQNVNN